MLLKSYHLDGFRGVYLRDNLPTKTKLNECGILNLDSSSGDGTHWVMWFKKGNMEDMVHWRYDTSDI